MCGIVGYIGKNPKDILLNGLKELEYRGYDSAGIALKNNDNIKVFKAVGKIKNLEDKIEKNFSGDFNIGIGHTRWATHGKPTEINAHPHKGKFSFIVHNGIIENYKEIKEKIKPNLISQTDTEVIVYLFEYYYKKLNNYFEAFKQTINDLKGAFAILLITKEDNNIFFAKQGSPLAIAKDDKNIFFASSNTAVIGYAKEIYYFEDNTIGYANNKEIKIFIDNKEVKAKFQQIDNSKEYAQKDGYRFFMEKEIYEQPEVSKDTILGRVSDTINFEELDKDLFTNIKEITICACGTSYHSALSGSYLFQRLSKIKCNVEIASEFRYKDPILDKDSIFIVISQSGETADTLEALKMARDNGLTTIAICNVDNSSMTRIANYTILTRAGIEKGVASTKAFTTQMLILWMLALYIAQNKNTISKDELEKEITAIKEVPNILDNALNIHQKTNRLSKRYLHGHGFFFIGRDIFYPLALEGALKLKEISYLHAEGYPAGEMKHGPIALADPELFTIALLPKNKLFEKTKSNIEELIARDSTVCVISSEYFDLADDFIKISSSNHYMLEFFEMLVTLQLLAMEISIRLGNDVDMPKNLAKSVTVE